MRLKSLWQWATSFSKAALVGACLALLCASGTARAGDGVDQAAAKAALLKAYPGLFTIAGNSLTWNDGTKMVWDDGKQRTPAQLNDSPDVEDMFHYVYSKASAGPLTPAVDLIRAASAISPSSKSSMAPAPKPSASTSWA